MDKINTTSGLFRSSLEVTKKKIIVQKRQMKPVIHLEESPCDPEDLVDLHLVTRMAQKAEGCQELATYFKGIFNASPKSNYLAIFLPMATNEKLNKIMFIEAWPGGQVKCESFGSLKKKCMQNPLENGSQSKSWTVDDLVLGC